MTHSLERSLLSLAALGALGACAAPSPNFPIYADPLGSQQAAQAPPPAAQAAPPVRTEEPPPAPPRPTAPVESRPLDAPPPAPPAASAYTPPREPEYRTVTTRSVTGSVVEVDGPRRTYQVKSGDNLEKIARSMGTTVSQLKADNDLKSSVIHPGDELKGPRTRAKAYVVAQGDTLSAIGRRFDVSASAIAGENEMSLADTLRVGQRLRLPEGFRDRGPIVSTTRVAVDPPRAAPPVQTAQASPPPAPAYTPPPVRRDPAPAPAQVQRQPEPPPPARSEPPAQTASRPPPPAAPTPRVTVPGAPVASPPPSDSQVAQMGRGRFVWPVRGEVISGFGPKGTGQRNDGVNIRAGAGETVRAAAAGEVVYAGDQVPGFGNLVLIKHEDGWVTAYGHLSQVGVKMQQRVTQGQQIGLAGASGGVSEPQLHFEVRYAPTPEERAKPVDPALVLPR